VVVDLWTDQVQRLEPGSVLTARSDELRVLASRPFGAGAGDGAGAGAAMQRFLVFFEGVTDRGAAERLHGVDLEAPPLEDPDALWVHELVGAAVRDPAGTELGRVEAVEANPASDLMVLESGALIPVRFVVSHDAAAGVVEVDIPEGLLDL